jgi:endonuclease/exonuclease/phosphatase family metal-dependent hydrolase
MKLLTYNVGLLDLRLFGRSLIQPAAFIPERFAALAAALLDLDPDIAALQEIYEPAHKRQLVSQLANTYPYAAISPLRGPSAVPASLLTLSKWPIRTYDFHRFKDMPLAERLIDNKGFLRATIEGPQGELQLLNVHTTAGGTKHPEDPRSDAMRAKQIEQLLGETHQDTAVLLVGDFNCGSVSTSNYGQIVNAGFRDVWQALNAQQEGWTWEPTSILNAGGTHTDWGCPAQRIDLIMQNDRAADVLVPANARRVFLAANIPIAGGPAVTLSDHYGVLAEFELASRR